jgi:hypothetical protein
MNWRECGLTGIRAEIGNLRVVCVVNNSSWVRTGDIDGGSSPDPLPRGSGSSMGTDAAGPLFFISYLLLRRNIGIAVLIVEC